MAGKQLTVVGPAVVLPDSSGKIHYFYQGSVLPDGLVKERVESAVADGLVKEVDPAKLSAADLEAAAAGDRLRAAARSTEAAGDDDGAPKRPARTANKATWAAYRGLTEEQAEAVTLDELKDDEFMSSYDPSADESSDDSSDDE